MIIESNVRVSGGGNLSLGQAGYDDGQADPLALYGKKDCRYDVLNGDLLYRGLVDAHPVASLTESVTRVSAGIWTRTYTAGGAAAPFINFILPEAIRTGTGLVTPPGQTYNLHGYKVTSIDLNYILTTADLTSIAVTAQTETAQTNNVARANASVTPLGAVTYQNPIGTVVATLPVAQQAAPYQCRVIFATPVFVPTNNLTFEIGFVMQNNGVMAITGLWINYTGAWY